MNRAIQFVGVVWLWAGGFVCLAQKPPKTPPPHPSKPPAAPKPQPNNNGGVPKAPPKMANPDNPIDRLFKMTPEQRERVLEKYPPKQQANLRKQLDNFDSRPEAEKQFELNRLNKLWSLPPDKQALVKEQMAAFKALPPDRLPVVRAAYFRLSRNPEERETLLARPQFRARFSPAELQMLTVLPVYWPAPPKPADK